jgi:N6-L-threonylcarbamoyladenine synthase
MNVLGIETSCDETAAAVVREGRQVLSSIVFSQVDLHRPYGGVVPEIASRSHVEALPGVVEAAVEGCGLGWEGIDAIAATYGPGLSPSLLVGLSAGKALALRLEKPFIAVNHVEAHVYSPFIGAETPPMETVCPFVSLVVSGGHTTLLRVDGRGTYTLLGQTIDDAAGEAFDKGANLLGLGYPGGPIIDKTARGGNVTFVAFPRGRPRSRSGKLFGLDPELCFSFSGLKTSLLYYLRDNPVEGDDTRLKDIAASYQEAIVDALVMRCEKVSDRARALSVVGGVSLNSRLRERVGALAVERRVPLLLAEPRFCADNAAMIAGVAGAGAGLRGAEGLAADASPSLPVALPPDAA